jgi:hypothetical protein
MSGSTTELNLKTAVDSDDTADYLTISLADSLRSLDALYNNVTGHNHSGAHQGGPVASVPATAIADGSITSAKIADGAIATVDLADGCVIPIKLNLPRIDLVLGVDYALAPAFNSTIPGLVTAALPANSIWDFFWAVDVTCTTDKAQISANLLNAGGAGLSAASDTIAINYAAAQGTVSLCGRMLFLANSSGSDTARIGVWTSHAATLKAVDPQFGTGPASYIRGVRIG